MEVNNDKLTEKEVVELFVDLIKQGYLPVEISVGCGSGLEKSISEGYNIGLINDIENKGINIKKIDEFFYNEELRLYSTIKVKEILQKAIEIIEASKEEVVEEETVVEEESIVEEEAVVEEESIVEEEAVVEEESIVEEEAVVDEYEYDEELNPELTEKAKKLIEKVDLLCDKIEQEKNPFKRHILQFKIKMLVSKIQKEIDIQNIQDKYDRKRELAESGREGAKDELYEDIAKIQSDIDSLKDEIKGHEEYDYESKHFLYSPKVVEREGGIKEFTEKLKESEKPHTQAAAEKIEHINQAKEELKNLKEELKAKNDELKNFNKNYNKDIKSLNREEKALVKKEKGNIFSRIGNFFGTLAEETKLYLQEKQELKEMMKNHKKEMKELKAMQDQEFEDFLKKQADERKELTQDQEDQLDWQKTGKAKDAAAAFRASKWVPKEEMIEESPAGGTPTAESIKELADEELVI